VLDQIDREGTRPSNTAPEYVLYGPAQIDWDHALSISDWMY